MDFIKLENIGKKSFERFPLLKRIFKRVYQIVSYFLSIDKFKARGNLIRLTPDDGFEYFYGYYDKSPWDANNRFLIALKVKNAYKNVAPKELGTLVLIDTQNSNRVIEFAKTNSWNVQQGCMAQWLGPDFKSKIIYNDFRNGKYCSVIYDINEQSEIKVLSMPIYDVSKDGKFALSLDFSRLHRMRPGYGYSNLVDSFAKENCPNEPCIWKINIETDTIVELKKYTDFANFEPNESMKNASHKVNHLMISPNGMRFMVLHRWLKNGHKYTRLVTINMDGSDMYNLSDDVFASHSYWKNDTEVLSFLNKKEFGNHYYLMKDKTQNFKMLWQNLNTDGHCSYSPDGKWIITDTYPNRKRIASVFVCQENECENGITKKIASVFSPFRYDNDCRCDLHPRWNRTSDCVCIDSVHEGKRGIYEIEIKKKDSRKKILFFMTRLRKSGPIAQTLDLIKNLDKKKYIPITVSLYNENRLDSLKQNFEDAGAVNYCLGLGRFQSIFLGKKYVKKCFAQISPDLIHSVGMPLFRMALSYKKCQNFTTIHNYVFEDYPVKYGKIIGKLLAKQDIRLIKKHALNMVTCSKSLAVIYNNNHFIDVDFIRNGVDTSRYQIASATEKIKKRELLGIPFNSKVLVFTGQVCSRKNQFFIIDAISKLKKIDITLLILGDGPDLLRLQKKFGYLERVQFKGHISNISDYLKASDVYVSSSTSEGLPIGVLEAMSSGLPLLLSDIPQHKEIVYLEKEIGFIFKNNDYASFNEQLKKILCKDLNVMGTHCNRIANEILSAEKMANLYMQKYEMLLSNVIR